VENLGEEFSEVGGKQANLDGGMIKVELKSGDLVIRLHFLGGA
jgi:hypothetical protein